ncbi:hypothetical protein IHE45_05G163000 [Dioscorea alata]|uniref:Uncharacterized protein n=1 Tax=Dioscorea alata TaxID=55571 RepID=A0ACB7W6U4_DIOAL|nr:hypothetical protein IHE45_05G163000 [Dioscorea alata]
MGLPGKSEMCGGENTHTYFIAKYGLDISLSIRRNSCKRSNHGMAVEQEQMKSKTTSAFTSYIVHFSAPFRPWSLKIPLGDGYHESLVLDLSSL